MADSAPAEAEEAPVCSSTRPKGKCSPEQLERLAKAREKALEKRAALAGLKQKEKELADLALKDRFRRAEQLEREYKEKEAPPPPKSSAKARKAPPPPPSESCSSSETEEEEYEPPPPPPRRKPRHAHAHAHAHAVHTRTEERPVRAHAHAHAHAAQDDWLTLARRVFPGL